MRKILFFLVLISCVSSLYALVSPAEPVFRGYLRQGSAQGILCGPFIDDTDLKTIVDDATITDTALLVVKADGTSDEDTELQTSSGGDSTVNTWNTIDFASFTDDSFGMLGLTATNTSTLGNLIVQLYDTGADNWVLPPYLFIVLPPLAYDLQYGGIVDVSLVNRVAPFNNLTDTVIPVPFVSGTVATYTSTTSITLDTSAAATANLYKGHMIEFPSGTGANQSAIITAYTSGRVATLAPALNVALDTTTTYRIYPGTLNVGTVVLETPFDNSTDTVQLANDTITSAKYDESTAFPLQSADTGSTAVARVGADSDTLETLSDQMDATDTAAEIAAAVWNALTASYTSAGSFGLLLGIPIPPAADYGPNAGNAIAEKTGATPGSTLSTGTTIYLATTDANHDTLYEAGNVLCYLDTGGMYQNVLVSSYNKSTDTITLTASMSVIPVDATPIYSLGKAYSTQTNASMTSAAASVWSATASAYYSATGTFGKALYDLEAAIPSSLSGGIALTGSSRSYLVFDTPIISTGGYLSVDRCWAAYTDTSTGYAYPLFIVKSTAGAVDSITVFPSLPVDPAEADTIIIYPTPIGLTPMDITRYSKGR